MKKRLMVGLLSAGLVVAMLPGVGLATGATEADVTECRAEFTSYGFANVGECVKHVATGGTLSTFESVCGSLAGAYHESYSTKTTFSGYLTMAPACVWSVIDRTAYDAATPELGVFCSGYTYGEWHDEADPDYYGCTVLS